MEILIRIIPDLWICRKISTDHSPHTNCPILASLLLLGFSGLVFWQRQRIKLRKMENDKLLLNILPAEMADELKRTGGAIAKQYNLVTVLFTDFVNFTGISEQMIPTELVKEIDRNFKAFVPSLKKRTGENQNHCRCIPGDLRITEGKRAACIAGNQSSHRNSRIYATVEWQISDTHRNPL